MKKVKLLSIFIVFALSFLCHFMYDLFPNMIFSIFFPVNESVWEHMKIIYTAFLLSGLIEYLIIKKNNIKVNNFLLSYSITGIIGIIIYLIMYLPLQKLFGYSFFLAVSLLFITFIIMEIIDYYILKKEIIQSNFIIGLIIIVFVYFLFGVLTYYPLKIDLFKDSETGIYGIEKG
jgi:hypothetical protein